MARVKRAVHGRKHHRAVLEQAKGYYGNKSRSFRAANEQVMHSLQYAYRDRRARKGDFRQLRSRRSNAAPVVDRALAAGVRVYDLDPGVMELVADTVTPQPVLAVAGYVDVPLDGVRDATLVVVCVDVRDPGNAGTVLRSAEAAGAGAVV